MDDQILTLLSDVCGEQLHDNLDIDLFDEGLLDSLAVAELVVAVEDTFDVTIPFTLLDREQIRTPRLFVEYINQLMH